MKLYNSLINRQGDRSTTLWYVYNECFRMDMPAEHCFW